MGVSKLTNDVSLIIRRYKELVFLTGQTTLRGKPFFSPYVFPHDRFTQRKYQVILNILLNSSLFSYTLPATPNYMTQAPHTYQTLVS